DPNEVKTLPEMLRVIVSRSGEGGTGGCGHSPRWGLRQTSSLALRASLRHIPQAQRKLVTLEVELLGQRVEFLRLFGELAGQRRQDDPLQRRVDGGSLHPGQVERLFAARDRGAESALAVPLAQRIDESLPLLVGERGVFGLEPGEVEEPGAGRLVLPVAGDADADWAAGVGRGRGLVIPA